MTNPVGVVRCWGVVVVVVVSSVLLPQQRLLLRPRLSLRGGNTTNRCPAAALPAPAPTAPPGAPALSSPLPPLTQTLELPYATNAVIAKLANSFFVI